MGETNYPLVRSLIPEKVNLVAVVKSASLNQIKEVLKEGCNEIGFNTLQQFENVFREIHPVGIKIHFIGHIQSNKLKKILKFNPYLIQSVDSIKLLKKMNKICLQSNTKQNILLQIKTDKEKEHGFDIENISSVCSYVNKKLQNLNIMGLMTIPGKENTTESFQKMKRTFQKLKNDFKGISILSMGMSEDYILAIENGSTMVRIGKKIFS